MGTLRVVAEREPLKLLGPMRLADAQDCNLLSFDCGDESINKWLWQRAGKADGDTSRAHVLLDVDRNVVAYFTLHAACVPLADMPTAKLRKNRPDPIPAVLIGRAGVAVVHQGQGIFRGMLKHALNLIQDIARNVAVSLVLVQPIHAKAAAAYTRLGFTPIRIKNPGATDSEAAMPPPMILPLASISE